MTSPALVGNAGTVASGTGSVTPSFGQATTAGNLLIAWANSDDPATGSFPITIDSTSEENGWTLIGSAGAANGYNWNGLWYKADCGASETAPTFSDSGYTVTSGLSEYSDVAASSPLDRSGTASDADPCTASAADTAAGDLVLSFSAWNGSNPDPGVPNQSVDGSNGTFISGLDVQYSAYNATEAPFYVLGAAVNDATLGTHANKVSASIGEYENYVSSIIASFKAA